MIDDRDEFFDQIVLWMYLLAKFMMWKKGLNHWNEASSSQRYAWWAFWGIVLLLNVPNSIPWEKSLYPGTYYLDLQERLFKCILLASVFLSMFARPFVAWLVSWCLFLWWLPASFAVRWMSDAPFTANLVGMALASSPGELRNLAISMPVEIFVFFLAWNTFCAALLIWLRKRNQWRWGGKVRLKIFCLCGLLLLVPYIADTKADDVISAQHISSESTDPFKEADQEIGSETALSRAFPYELPWAIAQYWRAKRVVDAAHAGLGPAPQAQRLAVDVNSPAIVVLVIGESSSRNAWHLFNPAQHATTPNMEARVEQGQGLYSFSNVVAQSTSTRQSVPSMLTSQPLLWPDGSPNPHATRSIVSLASKAGYSSAWFSNQAAIGRHDGVIAAYADEADSTAFLNPSSFFQQGTHDGVLLPALQRHLANHSRSFVILHTMGSHFRFEQRYPQDFGLFPAGKSLNQTYLNSVAYTDTILEQVIAILERDGRSAVMMYVSDHGQGVPDAKCSKSDINRVTADSYEVPALLWLSRAYETAHPGVPGALRENAESPYTTAAVHQTLKDLVSGGAHGTDVERLDAAPSFLRKSSASGPQIVISPDVRKVEFKEAVARNPCFIKSP